MPRGNRNQTVAYRQLFNACTDAFNDDDPMGLLAMGAPIDEYAPEVEDLLPRLRHCHSVEDVEQALWNVFVKWFGAEAVPSTSLLEPLAVRVWAAASKIGGSAGSSGSES